MWSQGGGDHVAARHTTENFWSNNRRSTRYRAGGGVYVAAVHGPPPFKTLSTGTVAIQIPASPDKSLFIMARIRLQKYLHLTRFWFVQESNSVWKGLAYGAIAGSVAESSEWKTEIVASCRRYSRSSCCQS